MEAFKNKLKELLDVGLNYNEAFDAALKIIGSPEIPMPDGTYKRGNRRGMS